MKKLGAFLSKFFNFLIVGVEALILVISIGSRLADKTPTIAGYSFYVVVTPSMEGVIDVGDVIVCHDIDDPSEIKVGDIVTYEGLVDTYEGKKITHEVIDTRCDNGYYYFTTKGTANDSADPEISQDQLVSKFVYKTVVFTFLYNILTTIYGFIALIVVPILYIIINEIISVIKENKEDKQDGKKVHEKE